MKIPVYNMSGVEVDTVELPTSIFEAKVNRDLMHQALVRQMANARLGTHKTKGRSDVNRSTRKIYRQKGTGNARHGSRRAPIFVGGGVAHGPKPRSYVKSMPRKMRRAALRSALTVKVNNDDLLVVDKLELAVPKTKEIATTMQQLAGDSSILILLSESNVNIEKSASNLAHVKTLHASYLNIRDLLGYDKIVMPLSALDAINNFLGLAEYETSVQTEEEE